MTRETIVESVSKPRWLPLPLPLIIGMVVTAIVGGGAGVSGPGVAYLLGYSTTLAVIAWAAVWFGFLRHKGDQKSWLVFLWLYAASFCGGLTVNLYQEAQVKASKASLLGSIEKLYNGERNIDTGKVAAGDIGVIEGFMKSVLSSNANDWRDYQAELEGLNIPVLFSEENLSKDRELVQTRFQVKRAGEIVEKYRLLSNSRADNLRKEAEKLSLSEENRRQLLLGLQEGEASNGPNRQRIWAIEAEMVQEYAKAANILARRGWQFEQGQLQFNEQGDLDAFNASMERVQALAKEEETITSSMYEGMKAAVSPP